MSTFKDLYKSLFETQENKWKTGLVGMIIITFMLAGVFNYEANAIDVVDEATLMELSTSMTTGSKAELVEFITEGSRSGHTNEQDSTDERIIIENERLLELSCILHWADEASDYFQGTNEPDEFKVSILTPKGEVLDESEESTSGTVTASARLPDFEEDDFIENYVGDWIIRVQAGNCGDDSAFVRLGGLRTTPDTGNDWTLDFSFKYMDYEEPETGD